jgi:hypothetical protein
VKAKWEALKPLVVGQKIALALPDGTKIQGMALAIGPDGLRMKVSKMSNRKVMRKGERKIPRVVPVVAAVRHSGDSVCGADWQSAAGW